MPTIHLSDERYTTLKQQATRAGYNVARGRDSQIGDYIEALLTQASDDHVHDFTLRIYGGSRVAARCAECELEIDADQIVEILNGAFAPVAVDK